MGVLSCSANENKDQRPLALIQKSYK